MAPQSDGAGRAPFPATDASASANDRDVLRLFSYLWAAAVLFHIGSFDLWSQSWLEVLAALWVLTRPGSTLALSVLMALHLQATLPVTPRTANHALFASAMAVAFLLSVGVLVATNRRLSVDRAELFRVFGPSVRWSLIALYFFAAFHKLNADWFDPAVSCGAVFYAREREVFPFLPASPALAALSIHASLGFEMAIPLLLVFRSTRHLGILAGMLFHWILATNPLSGFYNFSSMLFATFALFASGRFVAEAADLLGRKRLQRASWIVAAIVASYAFLAHPFLESVPSSRDVSRFAWWVYGTSLLAAFAALLLPRRSAPHAEPAFVLPRPILAVVPLLVFLNGAAPHLGLQTTATWAMFSNLRTEGGRSNHFLIPAAAQIFDYQRDVVQIVRSSDEYLQSAARRYIPYFEVRRHPDASIVYVRRGVEYKFDRAVDDPEFSAAPRLAASLMVFRPVDRRLKQPCVH